MSKGTEETGMGAEETGRERRAGHENRGMGMGTEETGRERRKRAIDNRPYSRKYGL